MIHPALLLHGLLLAGPVAPSLLQQETPSQEEEATPEAAEVTTAQALAEATRGAQLTWEAMCKASLGDSAPITAFHIEAKAKSRDKDQRNEGEVAYSFMAPHCVRFKISKTTEMGRSGRKKADYWMRDKDEVITLKSKDYKADRESIRDMAILAQNYIALSNPKRLRLQKLEALHRAPREARQAVGRHVKDLSWLSITSPDFALLGREDDPFATEETLYRVDFGLRPQEHEFAWTPEVVIVRTLPKAGETEESLLLRLFEYKEKDGFRIPHQIAVHHRDYSRMGHPFKLDPTQEIWIKDVDLRAEFQVADFRP